MNENCPHCSASTTATGQQAQQCVRSVNDASHNSEVRWYMEDNNRISHNEKKDYTCNNRQAAGSAIAQLNGIDGSRDTLVRVGGVRIDRQGRCSCNGRQYVNIQVQVNRLRGDASDSTTIATALRLVETDE